MNVSIATVAEDVGTTVTGHPGRDHAVHARDGGADDHGRQDRRDHRAQARFRDRLHHLRRRLVHRRRIAPNLPVLLFGWSFLEGVGAALILPAIVALVAGNFPARAAAGCLRDGRGGGRDRGRGRAAHRRLLHRRTSRGVGCSPARSWSCSSSCCSTRRIARRAGRRTARSSTWSAPPCLLPGSVSIVFGVLRSGVWGWIQPKSGEPSWAGLSPTVWLGAGGLLRPLALLRWEIRARRTRRRNRCIRPGDSCATASCGGGLTMFFFQFLVQAGVFFIVPLYLSVVLGLSALATGATAAAAVRTLLLAAALHPALPAECLAAARRAVGAARAAGRHGRPARRPRPDSRAGDRDLPAAAGRARNRGARLATRRGHRVAVPDEESAEVGGVQNTMTNLGASLGTAIAGSILFATLTSAFLTNIQNNPAIPDSAKTKAQEQVAITGSVAFVSTPTSRRPSRSRTSTTRRRRPR